MGKFGKGAAKRQVGKQKVEKGKGSIVLPKFRTFEASKERHTGTTTFDQDLPGSSAKLLSNCLPIGC